MTLRNNSRTGFTLIELMVAMTLTLFVMLILTQAFVTSLDVFDNLKGIGDMEGHLRTVATNVRHDLSQDHFEGKRRLSDPDFWNSPVKEGFFHVRQWSPSQKEGADSDSIDSYASFIPGSKSYHVLYFTSKLRANQREKVYAATLPVGSPLSTKATNFFNQPADALFLVDPSKRYNSPWATIAYFLVQTGSTDEIDNPAAMTGTPLHSLYRAEHLLVPNITDVNNPHSAAGTVTKYPNVSIVPDPSGTGDEVFNSPATVTKESYRDLDIAGRLVPQRRGDTPPSPPAGSTLLLTNVVSFNIRMMPHLEGSSAQYGDFQDFPAGQTYFDSSTAQQWAGFRYRLHALEISIRIWDQKTEQARQITIVQGL